MNFDANVLRAMLRMARRRAEAEVDAVCLRVGGEARDVRRSLRRLQAAGLVEIRADRAPRLTMTGFAVAVAMLPSHHGSRASAASQASSRAA
jgi:hypothetical protein